MSNDMYELVRKEGDDYVLYLGCASNDFKREKGRYSTLEEAIEAADNDTEYGLTFDIKTTTTLKEVLKKFKEWENNNEPQ